MKFTLSWLKDHLETDATLDEIVDKLTMIGLEVEHVDDRRRFSPFVIAKIVAASPHPNADRLKVLSVDTGQGTLVQVVCGAPNARDGLIGAFAAPGTYIPGIDLTLAVGNIRGVDSHGMMCSERELEISNDHEGIIDLPQDAPVGTPFAAYAGLDDPVIEIAVTPNRSDCLGVFGIARDLAATGLGQLKIKPISDISGNGSCPVRVRLEFDQTSSLCPAFGLRLVRDVHNKMSPSWLQKRLKAIGLRPINALVDVTNYMTYDRGRPLHVFDADKVSGDLVVRRGREGESFKALDEKPYTVGPENCVIADDKGIESLAGIMGGVESGCTLETRNVLIESALWVPSNIARTGRNLNIHSDARFRFERGVDPAFMLPGLELATHMVLDLCGGTPTDICLAGYVPEPDKTINFPYQEVKRLTGLDLSSAQINGILGRLGFAVMGDGDVVQVQVPTWRPDIDGKADVVEEVMRIAGVDKIAPRPLTRPDQVQGSILTLQQNRERRARRALAARGMMEAVTWSFLSQKYAALFGGGKAELTLANPISSDLSDMRPSLLPNLLHALQYNADHSIHNLALFEVGQIFLGTKPDEQKTAICGVRNGSAQLAHAGRHWRGEALIVDTFDAKADALAVLEALGLPTTNIQVFARAPNWYHPGRSGRFQLGPKNIFGYFGELHPATLKALDVDGPVVGFEIILEALPESRIKATRTKPDLDQSELLPITRDFAFVVDKNVSAASLVKAAQSADKTLVQSVRIFDVYEGSHLREGQKSVAIEVTLQPKQKTLTDAEIASLSHTIIKSVEKATGGHLRA